MKERLRRILDESLALPRASDGQSSLQMQVLRVIHLVALGGLFLYAVFVPFFPEHRELRAVLSFSALALNAVAFLLFRQGWTKISGIMAISSIYAVLMISVLLGRSVHVAYTGFIVLVLITGFLHRTRWALLLAALTSGFGFVVFIVAGRSLAPIGPPSFNDWVAYSIYLLITALLTGFAVSSLGKSREREKREWTQRQETETKLAASMSTLELALGAAGVVTWEWDLATGGIRWSENIRSVPGLDPAPGRYEAFIDRILPSDRPGVERAIADCLDRLTDVFQCEFHLILQDGNIAWVETRGRAIRGGEGPDRITGVLVDIQDRKTLETARHEREEELHALIGNLDTAVVLLDLRGVARVWNRKSLELFRIAEAQARHAGVFLNVPLAFEDGTPMNVERHPARLAIDSGEPITDRLLRLAVSGSGEPTWLLLNALPQYGSDGNMSGVLLSATDLTASRRMQLALRETEERWFGLLSDIPDHVISLDLNGRILFINRGVADIERAGLHGRPLAELLPPQSAEALSGLLARVFQTALPAELECRGPGESQWSCRLNPVRRGDQVVAVFLFARDVTRRREVEQALSESEGRFQAAFDFSPVGMALLSTDARLLRVNHRLSEILEYPEGELEGRHFIDITSPEDRAAILENIRRLLQGELLVLRAERRFLCLRGRVIWGQLMITLVRNEQGAPSVLVCQVQDITERRETEQALSESEKRLRAIVDSSPLGLQFWRLEEDGRLLFAGFNPAAARMWGTELGSRIGLTLEQAFPGLKGTELPERFRQAARTGENWSTRRLEYREDRVRGVFEFHAFRIAPEQLAVMLQDVTARQQAENELLQEKRFNESVVNTIPGVFVVCDQAGYLYQWNRALVEELGFDASEFSRMLVFAFVHPDDHERFQELLDASFTHGEANAECRVRSRAGAERRFYFSTSILDLDGRRLAACVGVDMGGRNRSGE